jgi:hypothetical protein
MGCLYTTDPTQPFVSSGVLDLAQATQYDAEYLVCNQLVPRGNADQLRTETSRIEIQSAVVRITDASGSQLATYSRAVSGTIEPATGTTPGCAPFNVTTIDHLTAVGQMGATSGGSTTRLITFVRFIGHTLGGQYVESNEFSFAVDVCFGCLVRIASGSSMSLPGPCDPGIDFPTYYAALDAGGG